MEKSLRHFLLAILSLTMLVLPVCIPRTAQAAAPTFSAEVTGPFVIALTFDQNMIDPHGLGNGGFSYTINGVSYAVNWIDYDPTKPNVYKLRLSGGIQPGATITLSYSSSGGTSIASVGGDLLQSFSNLALTNNVSAAAPGILMANTNDDANISSNDGTYVVVTFTLPMGDPPAAPGGFTVKVDNVDVAVTDIYRWPYSNSSHYTLRLGTAIKYGQSVRLYYMPGTVQSLYGVALPAEHDLYVSNYIPQPVSADLQNIALSGNPINFTFSGATYTYNNVTVANSVTGITVTPTGAGTITIDGATITSGNASDVISLTAGVQKTILVTTTEAGKVTKTYTIRILRLGPQTTPTFFPTQGAVPFGSNLQIMSAGADHIYYTTDGSVPATVAGGSTLEYNDSVRPIIDRDMIVRAIAVKEGWGNSEYASAAYTQAPSANLTGLELSGNPANFIFSCGIYTYNSVLVANAVEGITITPTGLGTITVNGTVVNSGTSSETVPLTVNAEKTITVTTEETGKAPITYTIKVTRLLPAPSPQNIITLTHIPTGASVTGYITSGTTLMVKDLTLGNSANDTSLRQRIHDHRYAFMLGMDISLSGTFSGALTISIPVGAQYNGQTVTVLYARNDGTLDTHTVVVANGNVVFTVISLSPFAVFAASNVNVPNTGESGFSIGFIAFTLGLTSLSIWLRRRRAYNG